MSGKHCFRLVPVFMTAPDMTCAEFTVLSYSRINADR